MNNEVYKLERKLTIIEVNIDAFQVPKEVSGRIKQLFVNDIGLSLSG